MQRDPDHPRPTVLIAGMGPGLGIEVTRAFAATGYDIVGLSRSAGTSLEAQAAAAESGGHYESIRCDLAIASEVMAVLDRHEADISAVVYNAHQFLVKPFAETSLAEFESVWRTGCLGLATLAGILLPRMVKRGGGALLVSGATASLRGSAKFAAFASAKFAMRGLVQALAREYGPSGVHVAHVLIDGLLDELQSVARFGDASSSRMPPQYVARELLHLAAQPPLAWTHELDLRPFDGRF